MYSISLEMNCQYGGCQWFCVQWWGKVGRDRWSSYLAHKVLMIPLVLHHASLSLSKARNPKSGVLDVASWWATTFPEANHVPIPSILYSTLPMIRFHWWFTSEKWDEFSSLLLAIPTPLSSSLWFFCQWSLKRKGRQGFAGGAVVENPPANAGDTGSSPGLGRYHMPQSN